MQISGFFLSVCVSFGVLFAMSISYMDYKKKMRQVDIDALKNNSKTRKLTLKSTNAATNTTAHTGCAEPASN
jgi:hypothetical protein